jgi:hypothetical protein
VTPVCMAQTPKTGRARESQIGLFRQHLSTSTLSAPFGELEMLSPGS